jgi:hypothetical protein
LWGRHCLASTGAASNGSALTESRIANIFVGATIGQANPNPGSDEIVD